MLFNSLQFCAFFVIVTSLYFLLPWQQRWKMLLVASCVFYMAFVPAYIVVLFTTILIDYWMGIKIAASEGKTRRAYLFISIIATCLVLFVFKYFNFVAITVRQLQGLLGGAASFPLVNLILPIGLSFHTFQSLSYVIEVYRGKQQPERNLGIYSLYVMFYPQLVAGPIERPQNLLHQFREDHGFDLENFSQGLRLVAWGFFQKMVIADRAAEYVNGVYRHWSSFSGLTLIIASLLFSVQVYADFSGYSTIAIGCARIMGFRLMRNFNHPYFSCSFSEFWKRWHISLSTWFRDYVYIPLGGNRVGLSRHYLNLLITFTISGLWHGANWTFVVWGAYNGILLILESTLAPLTSRLGNSLLVTAVRRMVTLCLICIGWVFFRAPHLSDAFAILRRMAGARLLARSDWFEATMAFSVSNTSFAVGTITVVLILLFFMVEWMEENGLSAFPDWLRSFQCQHPWGQEAFTTIALFQAIMMFGVLRASAFIYFQF
jgi:D-alanyl-lipoteichoic acid acyltransferase DltB (MBOAT superfamily)